jgi:GPH family glycoside/pentoside/hexuronide:cation symporter
VSEPHESAGSPTRVGRSTLLWYAVGSIPGGVGATVATFLVFYYNQVLGVPGAQIGTALLIASVFDAVTDPIAGALSDRTRSRWGRRHPYLFAMALPNALLFFALWAPPASLSTNALFTWLVGVLLVGRLVSTFYAVPYLGLGAELTKDYEERNAITAARALLFNVGRSASGGLLLLVFLRPTPEYPNGQLNPDGYVHFALLFSVVTLASLAASAWQTRGSIPNLSVPEPDASAVHPVRALIRDLSEALRLRSFRAFFFCSISQHIAWGVADALGLYMATYFWKVGTEGLFVWGIGMFTGLFAGLPFWRRYATGREKKRIYVGGLLAYLIFFCVPYLMKVLGFWPGEESPFDFALYVLTTGFLAHFAQAAGVVTGGSMLGDITDLDELRHGRRREGVIFGAESFGWKALVGIGSLIAGFTVDSVGLTPGMDPASISPALANRLGLAQGAVMTVFFIAALFAIRGFDLTRARHAEVRAEIESRAR